MAKDNQNGEGAAGAKSLLSSLTTKEVVIPAAATAAAALAYGARQGASEAKEAVEHEAESVGRHGAEGSPKKTRRLPIQRWTDVAVPIDKTYEQWTRFEEFPKFMHRVLNVKQEDGKVSWDEKIWFSRRHWEGEVTDRRKNRRIAWKTTSGMSHAGVVTFHSLDENLTRVMVTIDFVPQGMIEKMASGLRFVKRAVQGDLARFKAYVELGEAKGLEYMARPAEHDQDDADEDGTKEGDREQRQEAASG